MTVVGNLFAPMASLATAPLLARHLGVEGRGEVAAVVAPLLLVTLVAQLGVPVALAHLVARSPGSERRLLDRGTRILLLAGLGGSVALVAAARFFTGGEGERALLVGVAATGVVPSLFVASFQAVAIGLQRWRLVAAERLVSSAARLAAVAALAVLDQLDVVTAVLALALAPAAGGLVYLRLMTERRLRRAGGRTAAVTPSILRYGLPVWFGSLSGVLLARLDQVLLVPLVDAEQLGLYAVAVLVGELPLVANTAVRDVTLVDQSASPDPGGLATAARVSTLAVTGGAAVLALASLVGLPLVFGIEFAAAVPLALVLLVASAAGNPGSVAGAGLSGLGRPGLRSLSLAVAGAVNLGLLVALTPICGALGAALASLVGSLVASHLNIVLLSRLSGVRARDFYGLRPADVALIRRTASAAVRFGGSR